MILLVRIKFLYVAVHNTLKNNHTTYWMMFYREINIRFIINLSVIVIKSQLITILLYHVKEKIDELG